MVKIAPKKTDNSIPDPLPLKKVHYNRPLLIKEAPSRTAKELDHMVDQHVQSAIQRHLSSKDYVFDEE